MVEYIERETAVKSVYQYLLEQTVSKYPTSELCIAARSGVSGAMGVLDDVPAADVVPVVHGYWINTPPYRAVNGSYKKGQECSVCNAFYVSDGNTPYSNHPYCAECGAKMDGGNYEP